ncbi:TPA: tail fiber protein [Cronobacter sakazakii]|uniref:phage tail protein n=1 Tax=Cronobacter sakazakii TaxID=28141 RepID=UPI00137569DD|nr:phage tail protein [Cronobacter sakazakii]NCH12056.1 tail fiber protein [Cronobacter sakazakii]HDK7255656.1 tail fiber protein [Cronobacter sakazakii]HDK7325530.1 tail fiber protein [Cronobacter sakazakii]HDK7380498.1 tail fiber protein [Cronobacter sakazakii]
MHRIDTKTAQKDKFGAGKNGFTRGNPQTGTPATDLDDDYFDMLQEELCSVVEASGASLEKARHDQLLTALRALLLSRKNPFGDIKSDGTVKTALENLGLGEGSALPVGVPVPWPSATPPTGWLKCNGAPFTAAQYPKLAQAYPELKVPDLRGEFIRGWDDGRGVDAGRNLLSAQGHAYQSHSHRLLMSAGSAGSGNVIGIDSSLNGTLTHNINQPGGGQLRAIEDTGGAETRPRNIAFNYIVRAA